MSYVILLRKKNVSHCFSNIEVVLRLHFLLMIDIVAEKDNFKSWNQLEPIKSRPWIIFGYFSSDEHIESVIL